MDNELLEVLHTFLAEARGMLDDVEPKLIELCGGAAVDVETINSVFRLFHSVKGASASFGFRHVASVTHDAETLLDRFRQGQMQVTESHVQILLKVIDLLRSMLSQIEQTQSDENSAAEAAELQKQLKEAISAGAAGVARPAETVAAAVSPAPTPAPAKAPAAPAAASSTLPGPASSNEFAGRFVQEAEDFLDTAEQVLLEVEKLKDIAPERLREAFRAFHSFKGNCGFMGFADLERIGHRAEEVLEAVQAGRVQLNSDRIRILIGVVDVLRLGVAGVSKGGDGAVENCDLYVELVQGILPAGTPAAASPAPAPAKTDNVEAAAVAAAPGAAPPPPSAPAPSLAKEAQAAVKAGNQMSAAKMAVNREIRVNLDKLDQLINLVGELVISEAMVTRCPSVLDLEDEQFDRAVHQLRRITSELQDVAMSVRMIPLSTTFRKMTRLVHDLSVKTGKVVKLQLIGEETEVDKTVIEQIADPLVHIVRNSLDHGLETPEERLSKGKPESGTITIEAKHESGEVWIMVKDDGRGLNRQKILSKAVERGLVEGDGSALSEGEIYRLIFEPGFSTADKVTDISGRGVGMDVVKKNIEKLKGRVDLKSWEGKGSAVILRIPLTLAIMQGMLVRVGVTQYTIPILSIRESFRPDLSQVFSGPDGQPYVRVRNEVVPVVCLYELFHKTDACTDFSAGLLIIVESDREPAAFFVDEIVGQQETVIKGLSGFVGTVPGVSGCTILGDGQVSLILDVGTIIRNAEQGKRTKPPTSILVEGPALTV